MKAAPIEVPAGQKFELVIYNGKVKILINGHLFLCYTQLDFIGCYAYKDDTNVYGLDIYLLRNGGRHIMEVYFKTKQAWLKVLDLLNESL